MKRNLLTNEREFLLLLFNKLLNNDIPLIFLRNYDNFPNEIGNDLDLFIPKKHLPFVANLTKDLIHSFGGELVMVNERDYFFAMYFILNGRSGPHIHIDWYHGATSWHGLFYITETDLINQSIDLKYYRIPSCAHEAMILLMTSILWGGFYKERYIERINFLLSKKNNWTEFLNCFERAFGSIVKLGFDPRLNLVPDKHVVSLAAKRIRRTFKYKLFLKKPFQSSSKWLKYWKKEMLLYLKPQGLHLAFYGPDGAGKSTTITNLIPFVSKWFGKICHYHFRPGILPDPGILLGLREKSNIPISEPHSKKPHVFPIAFLRLIYLLLDNWLGYLLIIRKQIGQTKLVVFDRYIEDLWCDPYRYRFKRLSPLIKLYIKLMFKPNLNFILVTDVDLLLKRKSEVTESLMVKLIKNYYLLGQGSKENYIINTGENFDIVSAKIEIIFINFLIKKTETTWKFYSK